MREYIKFGNCHMIQMWILRGRSLTGDDTAKGKLTAYFEMFGYPK